MLELIFLTKFNIEIYSSDNNNAFGYFIFSLNDLKVSAWSWKYNKMYNYLWFCLVMFNTNIKKFLLLYEYNCPCLSCRIYLNFFVRFRQDFFAIWMLRLFCNTKTLFQVILNRVLFKKSNYLLVVDLGLR